MTLNKVTLVCDLYDGAQNPVVSGAGSLVPTSVLTDSSDHVLAGLTPVPVPFHAGGLPQVSLIATDNTAIQPAPGFWAWTFTPPAATGISPFSFVLNFSNGATQYLSAMIPISAPAPVGRIVTPVGGFLVPSPQPVSRRAAYRPAVYSQQFQAGHGWTAGGAGTQSGNMNDTSTFIRGTQCASATTTGAGVQSNISNTALSPPSVAGRMIRLLFKVDNVANLDHINFYLGTSNFANFFQWTAHTRSNVAGQQNWVQSGEWVTVDLQWDSVTATAGTFSVNAHGVPSVQSGFTAMRFAVYDNGAGPVTYHLQAVEIAADTTTTFPQGVVSVSFDDSNQNVFTSGRPVMDGLGYRGTLFTIQDVVASSNGSTYLTLAQLQQLASASGWDVQGHAYTKALHDAGYNTLTALQVEDEMRYLRSWMLSNGFPGDVFAYPHGWFGNTADGVAIEQIAMQYFAAARSIISETSEVGPAAPMPWRLKAITGINDGTALGGTTVTALTATGGPLDRCAANGSWLILTFHQIITGTPTDSTMCSQAGFTTVMNTIQSLGLPVLPVADVIRYYS